MVQNLKAETRIHKRIRIIIEAGILDYSIKYSSRSNIETEFKYIDI